MRKVQTYIDGLDEILDGGIPEGHTVLISGGPGTMKSSLAFGILYNNACSGIKGLYITLEQSRESLLEHIKNMGMEMEATNGNLTILDLAALRSKMSSADDVWIDFFKMYTKSIKKGFDYKLLVLDSLDALEILAKFEKHRMEAFELFKWLRNLGCTSFVITEMPRTRMRSRTDYGEFEAFSKHKEDCLADGIIHLKMEKRGDFEVRRQIRCVKMRSVAHKTGYFALIHDGTIRVTRAMA